MNINGRLGGFNPYYQANQRKMTQKPAEEEPKLKDVKPQANESTQPKRDETKYYKEDANGNLVFDKEVRDGRAHDVYITYNDGVEGWFMYGGGTYNAMFYDADGNYIGGGTTDDPLKKPKS